MKTLRTGFNFLVGLTLFLIFCSPIFYQGTGSNMALQKKDVDLGTIKIKNKAKFIDSIRLEGVTNGLVRLSLKNLYDKKITALQLSFGSVIVTEEFVYNEKQYIPPGETYSKVYPIQHDLEKEGVALLAVIYEDGASEGDSLYVREVTDSRKGKQTQYVRFLSQLKQIENLPDEQIVPALNALKVEIANAPSETASNPSTGYQFGVHSSKQDILNEIARIERLMTTGRSRTFILETLRGITKHYEDLSNRMVPAETKNPSKQ